MMKHIGLSLIMLTAATSAYAQTGNTGIGTSTPGSKLTVNGSFAAAYTAVTGNYAMTAADHYVVSNSAANSTVTLPAALAAGSGNYKGRLYQIKNTHTSSTLIVAANGAELIDDIGATGVATLSITPGDGVLLVSNGNTTGVTWEVVSYHSALPTKDYDWMKGANQLPTSPGDTTQHIYHIGGRVGIGRSSPLYTLHVQATEDDTSLAFAPNTVARFDPLGGSNINKAASIVVNGGRAVFGYEPSSPVSKYAFLRTNNSTDLRLQVNDAGGLLTLKSFVMSSQGSATGFIGLNTESPQGRLDVRGNVKIFGDTGVQTGQTWSGTSNVSGFEVIANNTTGDSWVGIQRGGTGAPLHLAKPTGAAAGQPLLAFAVAGSNVGTVSYNGTTGVNYNNTSDARLKENIRPGSYGLASLLQINVRDYNYISDRNKTRQTGFIAQELYKVFPQAVTVGGRNAKTDPWLVDYSKLTPVLVKAVQELNEKVEALEKEKAQMSAEIRKKESAYEALSERIDRLEQQLRSVERANSNEQSSVSLH